MLYNEREQAAACLCLCLEPFSIYLLELVAVLSVLLVVDAVQIQSIHLPLLRFSRLFHNREALSKGPVLEAHKCFFFQLEDLVSIGIAAVGRWDGSHSSIKLSSKLSYHSFTCSFSEGWLYS